MNHKEHNGWYNYQTWLIASWFANHQELNNLHEGWVDDAKQQNSQEPEFYIADQRKDWVVKNNPMSEGGGVFGTLLGSAIDEINFDEIAREWCRE